MSRSDDPTGSSVEPFIRPPRRLAAVWHSVDPLAGIGLAWLVGPLPGQGRDGLWWWHLAALGLAALRTLDWWLDRGVGISASEARDVRLAALPLRPGRRWRTVMVGGWITLFALGVGQLAGGVATLGQVVTFAAAAAVLWAGPGRTVGGMAVPRLALGGVLMSIGTLAIAASSLEALDGPFAYYRFKQLIVLPIAAHNVLASLLLVGAVAVVVASRRMPALRWTLPLMGLALGATLSRGAVLAGVVAVVTALVLRDRSTALRLGVVVVVAGGVVLGTLSWYGAPVPDPGGPTSVVARTELWAAAADAIKERPMAGVGLDGFKAYSRDIAKVHAPHPHAHNMILHAGATTGVVGIVAVLAVWGGALVGAAAQLDRDRRTMVVVAVVAIAAHAMIDETALISSVSGLMALLALAVAAPTDPELR